MDISIVLDDDLSMPGRIPNLKDGTRSFAPGQEVSGRVVLKVFSQKRLETVHIVFRGECCMQVSRNNITNNIFHKSKQLFEGNYTVQPTTLSWPFSFIIPLGSSHTRSRDMNVKLFDPQPQPLPGTCIVAHSGREAGVSYQLSAHLRSTSNILNTEVKQRIFVAPVSHRPLPLPSPTPIRIARQHYESNSLRTQKHSLKQKMAQIFANDPSLKTPSINFEATAHMPKSASVSQPLPLAISIRYIQESPTDPSDPTLILQRATLQLERCTSFRVNHSNLDLMKEIVVSQDFQVDEQLPLDNTPVEISDPRIRLADLKTVYQSLVPTFKSYTISIFYNLRIIARVTLPGISHKFVLAAQTNLEILPMEIPAVYATIDGGVQGMGVVGNDSVGKGGLAGDAALLACNS